MKFLAFLISAVLALVPVLRAEAPGAEKFAAGKRKTFSTQGHEKSKGVNLTISYPETWEATEGDTPNVVQVITSNRGFGTEMLMLQIKDLGTKPTAAEMAKYFTAEALKTLIPPGAKTLAARSATVLGRPGGFYEFADSKQIGVKTLQIQIQTYCFIEGSAMVLVHFQVGGTAGGNVQPLAQRMTDCKPLFEQMVKTITLPPAAK